MLADYTTWWMGTTPRQYHIWPCGFRYLAMVELIVQWAMNFSWPLHKEPGADAKLVVFFELLIRFLRPIALSRKVLWESDSIALTNGLGASGSLLELRQNPLRSYFRWRMERKLCPKTSSAKVWTQVSLLWVLNGRRIFELDGSKGALLKGQAPSSISTQCLVLCI
jgi:hypothetical protein